jgi:hypothetical protein
MESKDIIDLLHSAVANDLLARVQSGQATSQELSVAVKFLKDNGANLDVITAENPMADLLQALPFEMAERLQ